MDPEFVGRSERTPLRRTSAPEKAAGTVENIVSKQTKFDAPQTILVVGPAYLANGLATEDDPASFKVERTEGFATAADLDRALARDFIIVGADKPDAR